MICLNSFKGAHEKHNQIVTVSTSSTNASAVEEPLTTAVTVNSPPTTRRQRRRGCHCRGKGRETVTARCLCQQSAKRSGKHRRLKKLCQQEKAKNLKTCSWFVKAQKGGKTMKMSPSVPI
ncbi:hypothetical protein JOB18_008365 [Solea senegalensis]|uniref:Uncharacterized protein n=1 Tax=Solea senegalensis TaxID=28829 RepID=A0AAV6PNM8_SOLSE|nr:hypothetical protein JOB18_008365 [Solea senegalensis]